MSQKTNSGVQTNLVATDMATEINRLNFIIKSSISKVRTSIPVQVIAVSNAGGLSPVGTVNVQILVNAVDGAGTAEHLASGPVHGAAVGVGFGVEHPVHLGVGEGLAEPQRDVDPHIAVVAAGFEQNNGGVRILR